MKTTLRLLLVLVCVVALMSGIAQSQDLQQLMQKAGYDYAESYAKPLLTGFAADLNSAFYHSADLHDVLGFDVGLKFGLSKVQDADKTYKFTLPSGVVDENGTSVTGQVDAPTAIGEKGEGDANLYRLKSPAGKKLSLAGQPLTLPGGYNFSMVPLLMPQLAVGLPFGLELIGRYVPTISAGDAGKFNYMGFGLRYDVDQWIPMFPIDIAVHFVTQKMNFKSKDDKDIFSASGTAYGVEVSKKLLFITLYGGFQLEKATVDVSADPNGLYPAMSATSPNSSRATVGVRLMLLIINVHAEYSMAKVPVLAAGVGISLR
jgi:hypothetical protein